MAPGRQLGDLLYKTLFDEAEELRGMFFNLTQARAQSPTKHSTP